MLTTTCSTAWLCAALLGLGALSCRAPAPTSAPLEVDSTAWHASASAAGTWSVRWRGEQEPLPFGEPCALWVEVTARDGSAPAPDLELRVDAGMPAHGHGTLRRAQVTALGAGRFQVAGLYLHMPGTWMLYLDVGRAGVFERCQVEFEAD